MKQVYYQFLPLTVLFIFLFSPLCQAGGLSPNDWYHVNGPYGGIVKTIGTTPGGALVLGTKQGGIFRSINNGAKWLPTDLANLDAYAFAIDSTGALLAGTSYGVFRSFDDGNTWYRSSTGMAITSVYTLAVDQNGVIYAGTADGLYISYDNSLHWNLYSGISANLGIYSLVISPSNFIFAGTGNGIFRSDLTGTTWTLIDLQGITVRSLVFTGPSTCFAGTNDSGLYQSTNSGLTWFFKGFNSMTINTMAFSKNNELYVGTNSAGIFQSTDFGASWSSFLSMSLPVYTIHLQSATDVKVGTLKGVLQSANTGSGWNTLNNGLTALFINALAVDGKGNGYVATETQGLYRTPDNGNTWISCGNAPNNTCYALLATPQGSVLAGVDSSAIGIYRSLDHGDSWDPAYITGYNGATIKQFIAHGSALYAVASDGKIYQSATDGDTWDPVNAPAAGTYNLLAFGVDYFGNLYASVNGQGILRSGDGGTTWVLINGGLPPGDIQALGFDSTGTIYAERKSFGGLFLTTNQGNTWASVGFYQDISSFATSPSGTIYAAISSGGIYKSVDGIAWEENSNGISNAVITAFDFNPSGSVFAGTVGNGIFVSTYRTAGAISGMKFFDKNKNKMYDAMDVGLANWQIVARNVSATTTGLTIDTTITDASGNYSFNDLNDGTYAVYEIQQDGWIQSYPTGREFYLVTIKNHSAAYNIDFGNIRARNFTAAVNSNWSNPLNWEDGIVPGDTDAVVIPSFVLYDLPVTGNLHSLRIANGGTMRFTPGSGPLFINNRLQIDPYSTFSLSDNPGSFVICNGDWLNNGIFDPGTSTIVFSGNSRKTIGYEAPDQTTFAKVSPSSVAAQGGQFYNLTVSGDSTYTSGNVIVTNQLTLSRPLFLSSTDTLIIEKADADAIADTGSVPEGTIRRTLGGSGSYRFESPTTALSFLGTSQPNTVTMTTFPGRLPDTSTLWYERRGGTVDTVHHHIIVDSVEHFSKWVLGIPGSGVTKTTTADSTYLHASAARQYVISAEGGSNFLATLQLRYEPSEIGCTGCEGRLELLRGPYVIDSVYNKWNLVALPLEVENRATGTVFPTAISTAFAYSGGYFSQTDLSFGTGYWLKFFGDQELSIFGSDIDSANIPVTEGWNLIGSISLPIDPSGITSTPEGIVSGPFFEYQNGYQPAGSLRPMHGYWVNCTTGGELILNARTSPSTSKLFAQGNEYSAFNSLAVIDAQGGKQTLYFGDRTSTPDRYKMPPLPPTGIFDVRYASNRIAEFGEAGLTKEIPIRVSSAHYPLTLSWNNHGSQTATSLVLDGTSTAMTGKGKVVVTDPSASIAIRFASSGTTPKQFALKQNFPNPFNPTTTIAFDLPENGNVSLKIYNLLGQQVASLLENVPYQAGSYTVQLNTTGWASGMYFYRLQSGQYVKTMKMMLVK